MGDSYQRQINLVQRMLNDLSDFRQKINTQMEAYEAEINFLQEAQMMLEVIDALKGRMLTPLREEVENSQATIVNIESACRVMIEKLEEDWRSVPNP